MEQANECYSKPMDFDDYRERQRKEEIDESFDAFDTGGLDREEFGIVVEELDDEFGGALGAAGASTDFVNMQSEAMETHEARSERAQSADESQSAELTLSVDTWESDPASYDFPGVDTPDDMDFENDF
jgi:hypothetical protein